MATLTIEQRAALIAAALTLSGGKPIQNDHAKAAMDAFGKKLIADGAAAVAVMGSMSEAADIFRNLSALNQQGEKAGFVTVERSIPALWSEVGKALAAIKAQAS